MKHILVVDDEIDILETITDTLEIEFEGQDVLIIPMSSGKDAMAYLQDYKANIDLIVTDLRMPEMDGLELTRQVKKLDKSLKVIVFTGHGDRDESGKLKSLGVITMIKKPFFQKLLDMVTESIA